MDIGVERIIKALDNNEKITIYGDYDVDGITSTAIIYDFLKTQGGNIDYYIPERENEGYGLSFSSISKIKINQTILLITVDCGITSIEEIKYLKENGIDVIVTIGIKINTLFSGSLKHG